MTWQLQDPQNPSEELCLLEYQVEAALSRAFATLAAGGWGSGKTITLLGFLLLSAMMSPPFTAGMVVQPTYSLMEIFLSEILLPAFSRLMTGHDVGRKCIYLPGGRKLFYRSGHKPERLQLANLAYLGLDEPHLMKREIFLNAIARARDKRAEEGGVGDMRIFLTSLPKIGWLSDEFQGKMDSERACYHFKTRDNVNLPKKYESRILASCPRGMEDCYLNGQFIAAGGNVYNMFNPSTHVIPWRISSHAKDQTGRMVPTPLSLAIDWSPRRPHVLWFQHLPPGIKMPGGWVTQRETSVCGDELYPDGTIEVVQMRHLCSKLIARGYMPLQEAITDPAGRAKEATSGESEIIQANRYLGIPIQSLPGQRVKLGVQHVQLALSPLEGRPYLYFSDSLTENPDPCAGWGDPDKNRSRSVLVAMPGYAYPAEKDGAFPDEPFHDDVFSHAADCVRYHVRWYYPEDMLAVDKWSVA